jgi:glutamine cyclotransferase
MQRPHTRVELVSDIQPKLLKYTILNTYPHDIAAYTQGLEFYRDTLYEGTEMDLVQLEIKEF